MDKKNIAAVVLAGGRSSRMGQNKALLDYHGKLLLDHMIGLLEQAGISDIFVSGNFEGYRCIPDRVPHEGPAYAMYDVLQGLGHYDGVLFVPVDMPFLSSGILQYLIGREQGGYFTGSPLPVFIAKSRLKKRAKSVEALLESLDLYPIILPAEFESCMTNANTPEEWDKALRA